ncbi:Hypothetical protein PBC10988_17690 [Planctomycetales bacterium 10988]|nr:Hypothetical protein PBC10988_17690 [Planctomycetales bacterium 10988]
MRIFKTIWVCVFLFLILASSQTATGQAPMISIEDSDFLEMQWERDIEKFIFTPDGSKLITISELTIRPSPTIIGVWDLNERKLLYDRTVLLPDVQYKGFQGFGEINSIQTAWADDGETLLIKSSWMERSASKLLIFRLETGEMWDLEIKGLENQVVGDFTYDRKTRVLFDDRSLYIRLEPSLISAKLVKPVKQVEERLNRVHQLKISNSGKYLIACQLDKDPIKDKPLTIFTKADNNTKLVIYKLPDLLPIAELYLKDFIPPHLLMNLTLEELELHFEFTTDELLLFMKYGGLYRWNYKTNKIIAKNRLMNEFHPWEVDKDYQGFTYLYDLRLLSMFVKFGEATSFIFFNKETLNEGVHGSLAHRVTLVEVDNISNKIAFEFDPNTKVFASPEDFYGRNQNVPKDTFYFGVLNVNKLLEKKASELVKENKN